MTDTGRVPDDDVQQCLAFNLRRATRLVSQHYDNALRSHGLRITQFNLLAVLANTGPITIGSLANEFAIDRTTLTRNLKVLEQDGYVEQAAGSDRRTKIVALTTAGAKQYEQALPAWRSAHAELVERLGPDFPPALVSLQRLEGAVKIDE